MQIYTAPMRGYLPRHPSPSGCLPQRPGASFLLARRGGLMKGRDHGIT